MAKKKQQIVEEPKQDVVVSAPKLNVNEVPATDENALVTADASVLQSPVKTAAEYRAISDATDGYLSEAEANLLTVIAGQAVLPDQDSLWIEIGSYKGKSGVLIAGQLAIAKSLIGTDRCRIELVAVDPHKGEMSYPSAYDEFGLLISRELSIEPNTEEAFKATINKAGLWAHVRMQLSFVTDYIPEKPVTFVFIDGLHDFASVNSDYIWIKQFLVDGAYVLFHDVDQWSGPTLVAAKAVADGELEKIDQADSLAVYRYKKAQ